MGKYKHRFSKIIMPLITTIAAALFVAFLFLAEGRVKTPTVDSVRNSGITHSNIANTNKTEDGDAKANELANGHTVEPYAATKEQSDGIVTGEDIVPPEGSGDGQVKASDDQAERDGATGIQKPVEEIKEPEEQTEEGKESTEEQVIEPDGQAEESIVSADEPQDEIEEESEELVVDVLKADPMNGDMNVIFVSDFHLNDYVANEQIGISGEERAAAFLDAVRKENEKKPVTAIYVIGDLSSDDLSNNTEGVLWFKEHIVDALDIPVYCLPGNHDVKTDKQWREIFGYGKNFAVELGDYVFLGFDTFNDRVNKIYNTWGKSNIDKNMLKEQLEAYEDKKVIVMTHFLHVREDKDTYDILEAYPNVKAVIIAHNHDSAVYTLKNFKVYTTGNFSKDFTDPIITRWRFLRFDLRSDYIAKQMIVVEHEYSTGYEEYSEEAFEILMGER